jgi:uncharacterized protein DUF5683
MAPAALALGLAIALPGCAPAHAAAAPAGFGVAQSDSMPPPEQDGGVIEIGKTEAHANPGAATGGSVAAGKSAPARAPLSGFDAPRWVMARSLLVPGWGQLHNGSWVKALGVASGEGVLIARMVNDNQALDDLNRSIEEARAAGDQVAEVAAVDAYNSRLNDLVRRQWLFAAVLTYSLLDAYIDAHFRNFDIEFGRDPALPGGVPPPPGKGKEKGKAASGEYRLALRWSF